MKQINIIRNEVVTNSASFETLEEINIWLSNHITLGCFGKPEHQVELLDANGLSFDPPQFNTISSEFQFEIEDITDEVEQEEININALKFLAETDFYVTRFIEEGISYPEEIKIARQAARERIVR